MLAKVILNPYSNRWNAQKRWPEAESALKAAGVDFELLVSPGPDQIVGLAEQAARAGCSPVIIAGGDGSIGEAVNGLARAANSDKVLLGPLGIIPLGSANDLVDNLGLPKDLGAAAQVIAAGNLKRIDLGKVNDRYFANNSAAGLEPYVTTVQEKITWIKGVPRYLVAAVRAILDGPTWKAEIEWDGGRYQGPISLVSVGNGPRTGGLFYMSPHADPFDGKLTFVYGYRATRWEMFQALPRAMKPGEGSYVELEGIHELNCTRLSIHLDKPSPAHSDGELFQEWIQDFEYSIYPGRLQVLLPG